MRGAMRAGMNEVLPTARQNVHSVSGELARGLKISTRIERRKKQVVAKIKATGQHAHIARFVEFGTKPHFISVQENEKAINRKTGNRVSMTTVNRNVLKIGANFVGPTIHHPGARKKAFLRPALDSKATAAVVAAGEHIKKRLTKEGINAAHITVEGDE